jgi:hypothetical protein
MFVDQEFENLSIDLKIIYQESLNLMLAISSARSRLKSLIVLCNLEKNKNLKDSVLNDELMMDDFFKNIENP